MGNHSVSQTDQAVGAGIGRLFQRRDGSSEWIGTAFAIGPRAFLTAKHVVDGYSPQEVVLGAPLFDPPQRLRRIERHPERDVALLLLDPAAPVVEPLALAEHGPEVGDAVVCAGFSHPHRALNQFDTQISSYDGVAAQFIAKEDIARGMSGGPVRRDGAVVGVITARDTDSGDHFLLSIDSFRDWLGQFEDRIWPPGTGLSDAQRRLLTALRNDGEVEAALIDAVRAADQPVRDLTAYRLQRIAHWRQRDFELDRRFVRLILLLDRGLEAEGGRFQEAERFDDLGALLAARPDDVALVLLGRPGCGKTTVLAHHEHELALAALREPGADHPFVFWVALNAFPAEGALVADPLGWLGDEWARRYPGLPPLRQLLVSEPRSLLLLDGLNEIPHRDPVDYEARLAHWRAMLRHLRDHYPRVQVVFTCRSLDYGAGLSDFQRLQVPQAQFAELDDDAIREFLRRHLPDDWETLWQHLRDTTQLQLERTPFHLSLEVRQFRARGRTARGPAELISGLVWQALQRELRRQPPSPALSDPALLGASDRQRIFSNAWLDAPHRLPHEGALLPGLIRLAEAMQRSQGGGKQIRLDWRQADRILAPAPGPTLRGAAWQLDLLDNDLVRESCAFRHQLLQEYFAGHALAGAEADLAPLRKPWASGEVEPPLETLRATLGVGDPLPGPPASGWEETAVHAAAITPDPEGFVRAVAERDLALAARCVRSPEVRVGEALKDELRQRLLARSQDPAADLRARIDAGLILGDLGDPRFPRRRGREHDYILPPLVTIPAGRYTIGSEEGRETERPVHEVELPAFQIGQYPVTNAEWQCFMEAGGYEDERWWDTAQARLWWEGKLANTEGMDWWRKLRADLQQDFEATVARNPHWTEHYKDQLRDFVTWTEQGFETWLENEFGARRHRQPAEWDNPRFNNPNQPVVGICWFEARAYCRWLAHESGLPLRLPGEAEWEAAARGSAARRYPWGDTFDAERANTDETHLRGTSPVGVFPRGGTPGEMPLHDLAGNVWEWTASRYRDYPIEAGDGRDDPAAEGLRVLRGGAWLFPASDARAAYRDNYPPVDRDGSLGLRVLCSPPSSFTDH